MSVKKLINGWIVRKALKHYGRDIVVYNSSLHTHFRENGVKTRGRFNIMLCVLLVIQSKYDRFLGIKNVSLDEDNECIKVSMELNKVTRLIPLRTEIEKELENILGKRVSVQFKYVNKLFGIDFYDVI